MESLTAVLKNHPFFRGFSPELIEKLVPYASVINFPPGKMIFNEGEEANHFYLILTGSVILEVFIPNYGPVTIERIEAGDVLGWSWLYAPHRWHFNARASEETRAILLNGKTLRESIEEDLELGFNLLKRMTRVVEHRLQSTRLKLIEFYRIFPDPDKARPNWEKLL